jgi:hypothetical protein
MTFSGRFATPQRLVVSSSAKPIILMSNEIRFLRRHFSWSRKSKIIFLKSRSGLVSIAAFPQPRIDLRSPSAHTVHPLLRRLPSLPPISQSCSLRTSYPVTSSSSTLNGAARVPQFWHPKWPKLAFPQITHTHIQKDEAMPSPSVHVVNRLFPC